MLGAVHGMAPPGAGRATIYPTLPRVFGKDRGCSAPDCTAAGYYSEVHHVTDYATCHTTGVNDLTFACGPHHRILQPGGWSTHKNARGDTEWIPPPHLEREQPRTNTIHHPEKLLRAWDDDDEW